MKRQQGVTVVELMITVAVLAIVAAIAIPAYQNYLQTSQQEVLLNKARGLQLFMNNYRIDNGTYIAGVHNPTTNVFTPDASTPAGLPPLGYRVDSDTSQITLTTRAGACGNIVNCYEIVAEDGMGNTLVMEQDGTNTFTHL